MRRAPAETFTLGIIRMGWQPDASNSGGFPPYFHGFRKGPAAMLPVQSVHGANARRIPLLERT
ncbi:hypothetical protein BN2476_420079 [Paraburkholderia piptadeniae]|uniref:Uncharacterized protein n=1 Tax=Paraburkholderia piptadeniae TaxID=1701573 RepID=A0A1N7SB06_9BURK|nr:hypothetical protein BN2476_420079 [Paraburkholderia piptadeniae]